MDDTDRERDRGKADPGTERDLPRSELNPITNPLLANNMGRWAQVYFTSPPEKREQAVEELLRELQAESGAPGSSKSTPKIAPHSVDAGHHFVVCPKCQHTNADEQRFCGICGFSLKTSQDPSNIATSLTEPAPVKTEPTLPAGDPSSELPNADWQWLRDKTIADLAHANEPRSSWKIVAAVMGILVVVALSYLVWKNREQKPHEAPAQSPAAMPEQHQGGSQQPAASSESPQSPAGTGLDASAPSETPVASENSSGPNQETPGAASDGGHQELEHARQYLEGQGVPRNTSVAAGLLWKSVAKENEQAVLLLSDLYVRGDGVSRSCEQARVLLSAAAKKGSALAGKKLREVVNSCR